MNPLVIQILRYTSVLFLGGGAWFLATFLSSGASPKPSKLGLRGLKRQQALQENEGFREFEPVIRWLGNRCAPFIPPEARDSIDRQLLTAGECLGLMAEEYVALSILAALFGLVVGAVLGFGFDMGRELTVIAAFLFGAMLPYLQIAGIGQERNQSIARGLPGAIDLMALSMSAGLDFPGALRQVVEKAANARDPLIEELGLILQVISLGRTRKDALVEFAARVPIPAVLEFTGALIQAEERGNPVAEVLSIQASSSRTRRSVLAEESAAKAAVKMIGPLILVFVTVLILILGPMMMKIGGGFG
jgi:tight adherence protein C